MYCLPQKLISSISGSFLLVSLNVHLTDIRANVRRGLVRSHWDDGVGKHAGSVLSEGKSLLSINYRLFVLHVNQNSEKQYWSGSIFASAGMPKTEG